MAATDITRISDFLKMISYRLPRCTDSESVKPMSTLNTPHAEREVKGSLINRIPLPLS
jgi:hypothetical protein